MVSSSVKSANEGATGARIDRSMFFSGTTSEKSASEGVTGASALSKRSVVAVSSKFASAGVTGARMQIAQSELAALPFDKVVMFAAKREANWSVRYEARIITFVFILLLFLFDDAKI